MEKTNTAEIKLGQREIASLAKVSVATVSRVLNGSSRVAPAVRATVLAAAAELNFDPLQRNKTKALGFVLSNRAMLHPYHSRILTGAEAYCALHGWEIVFLSFNYSPQLSWKELSLPRVVQRRDVVQGIILAGTTSSSLLELLNHKGIPYVVFGNNILGDTKSLKNDAIFSDEIQGGYEATRHLLDLGHRDICYVGNTRLPWFSRCFEGFRRAMEEAGLDPRQSSIDAEDATEIGYLGAKSLLARKLPCTAILAGSDATASGVYKGLRDSGLRIPGDVSVIGCDDTLGACLYPGLTTIREFPEQLGRQMVEALLERIAKPGLEPQRVTIPTELIKRDSCHRIKLKTGEGRGHAKQRSSAASGRKTEARNPSYA